MFTVSLYFHGNSNCHTGQGCNDRLQIPHGAAPEMRPRGGSRPDRPAAGERRARRPEPAAASRPGASAAPTEGAPPGSWGDARFPLLPGSRALPTAARAGGMSLGLLASQSARSQSATHPRYAPRHFPPTTAAKPRVARGRRETRAGNAPGGAEPPRRKIRGGTKLLSRGGCASLRGANAR